MLGNRLCFLHAACCRGENGEAIIHIGSHGSYRSANRYPLGVQRHICGELARWGVGRGRPRCDILFSVFEQLVTNRSTVSTW